MWTRRWAASWAAMPGPLVQCCLESVGVGCNCAAGIPAQCFPQSEQGMPAHRRVQVSASVYYAASLYHKQQKEYAPYYR